jgi:two-component system, OmpR family, sensor histidine kinase ChvG
MKLRGQLLAVTLVVVLIPVAGWQFVKTLEQSLRHAHEQALIDSATAIARTLASDLPESWTGPSDGLYVHRLEGDIHLDGHDGDWERWLDQARVLPSSSQGLTARLLLAQRERGRLHLLLRVDDDSLVFADPEHGPGDRVELAIGHDGRSHRIELVPMAPGWIETRDESGSIRVQGNWQPRRDGWTLELQVADPADPESLGLTVHDVDAHSDRQVVGRADTEGMQALIRRQSALDDRLARLLPDNTRAWATTAGGWVLAQHDARRADNETAATTPILFERLLGDRLPERPQLDNDTAHLSLPGLADRAAAVWMSSNRGAGAVVMANAPVKIDGQPVGRVTLERSADELLVLANQAVLRLFGTSLAGMLVITLLLIGFAVLLSERIRRLRDRAESAVLADGRVIEPISPPRAFDEIGDLGRSMAELIERQYRHQHYLRTLADKLAHELRTPLATIRSSLDNLEQVDEAEDRERYRLRAEQGCRRLGTILQSMSQAARVEEALDSELFEAVDLHRLLEDYVAGCEITYPEREFTLDAPSGRAIVVRGSADLLAQLLDKLVDNAVDFSPVNARIRLGLKRRGQQAIVQVDNPGPAVSEAVAETLFDSMVSCRPDGSEQVHLGLGLYIARLIVRHHNGDIRALGLSEGTRFEVVLPILEG